MIDRSTNIRCALRQRQRGFIINPFRFGGGGGGGSDPYFANVVSLLHFDGTNGSTTLTDVKGKTWTAFGNAALTTTGPKFGTASFGLDGTGDYATCPSNADFAFGTADFCVEFWSYWSSAKAISHIDFRGGTANSPRILLYNNNAAPYTDLRLFVNNADRITAPTGTLVVGAWQHIAIARVSGNTRLFVDGTQVGSTWADSTNYTAADWSIGRNPSSTARDFNGRFDDFRATNGAGRYSSNFTVPSSAFPNS